MGRPTTPPPPRQKEGGFGYPLHLPGHDESSPETQITRLPKWPVPTPVRMFRGFSTHTTPLLSSLGTRAELSAGQTVSAEPLPCLGRRSPDARAPGSRDPSTRPPHPHPSQLPRARSFRHEGPRRLRVGGGALELPTTPRPNLCEDRTLRKEPPPSPPESRFRSESRSSKLLPGLPDWEWEPFPPGAVPRPGPRTPLTGAKAPRGCFSLSVRGEGGTASFIYSFQARPESSQELPHPRAKRQIFHRDRGPQGLGPTWVKSPAQNSAPPRAQWTPCPIPPPQTPPLPGHFGVWATLNSLSSSRAVRDVTCFQRPWGSRSELQALLPWWAGKLEGASWAGWGACRELQRGL